jgi:hypothetical protein
MGQRLEKTVVSRNITSAGPRIYLMLGWQAANSLILDQIMSVFPGFDDHHFTEFTAARRHSGDSAPDVGAAMPAGLK